MKKIVLLCLLLMLCVVLILPVSAAETGGSCGDNLTWTLENGVLTVSGTGPMYDYGEQVVSPWEDMRMEVTEVIIENGVTTVGVDAFVRFENLAKVTLPNTLKSINLRAFADCYALKSINLPEGLTIIGAGAFRKCNALKELVIPASVTNIYLDNQTTCEKLSFMGATSIEVDMDMWPESKTEELWFYGDAPDVQSSFEGKSIKVYYPAGNSTWTESLRAQWGEDVTWVAKCLSGHTEVPDKAVEASCTTTGLTAGKHCSVCGEVTQKQQKVEAKGHSYGPWEQIKAPTEQEVGTQQRKCIACNDVEERDVPKLTQQEQKPTEDSTQPTEGVPPTEPQTEPQGTEPQGTEPQGTESTEPTPEPTEPAIQVTKPESKTPWAAIIVAGVLILAGGAAAVWVFVIKKRK